MSALKRSTEVRQTEIAEAALGLIAQKGMTGLNVAAVGRKVGIVPSGIYRHYRNKTAVLDAILDFIHQRLSANVQNVRAIDGNAVTRLRALLMRHVRLIQDNEAIPLVVFSPDVYSGSSRRRAKLLGIIDSYLAEVAAIIEIGKGEGTVRADVTPGVAAVLFLGLIQPSMILWHLSAGKWDVKKHAEAAWPMFCRAIQSDHPRETREEP